MTKIYRYSKNKVGPYSGYSALSCQLCDAHNDYDHPCARDIEGFTHSNVCWCKDLNSFIKWFACYHKDIFVEGYRVITKTIEVNNYNSDGLQVVSPEENFIDVTDRVLNIILKSGVFTN